MLNFVLFVFQIMDRYMPIVWVFCNYCRSVVQEALFPAHLELEVRIAQLRGEVEEGREAEAKGQVRPSNLPAQDKSQKPDSTSTL